MQDTKTIEFTDITNDSLYWDKAYNKYGIAFRNNLKDITFPDGTTKLNFSVFIICLHGQMSFSENGRILKAHAGEVVVRLPGSFFSDCMLSPDFECKLWCFSPELTQQKIQKLDFFDKALRLFDNPILKIDWKDENKALMDAYEKIFILKAEQSEQQYFPLIIENLINCIEYEISSGIPQTEINNEMSEPDSKTVYFKRFATLLTEDKGRRRNVKNYASQLNISAKYLSVICNEMVGKTAFQLITEVQKKEIERLLSETNMSVKEITSDLNFPDSSFFSKYVRQHFGMTALEYREKLRQENLNNS